MDRMLNGKEEACFQKALTEGYQGLKRIEEGLAHIQERQEELLLSILSANQDTEYGRKHHFSEIQSFDEYCKKVPLSVYRDYRPYVRKMMQEGRSKILFCEDTFWYALTSGTTGRNKYIPLSKTSIRQYGEYFFLRGLALADQKHIREKGVPMPQGHFLPLLGGREYLTPEHGESCGSIGAANVKLWKESFDLLSMPPGNILVHALGELELSPYIFLRYSLPCRDIVFIFSIYDDYVLNIFSYLEQNWALLCEDIEKGGMRSVPGVSEELKRDHEKELPAMPERAAELREIFGAGFDRNTCKKIWPDLQLISVASKKGHPEDGKKLQDYLGGVAYDNSPYGASEGILGVSESLGSDRLVPLPEACVYEFLPANLSVDGQMKRDGMPERPLRLHELQKGKSYELVITTCSGLYRYQLGDIVEVVDQKGDCPLLRFQCRRGVVLDLVNEKTTEEALRKAIIVAAARFHMGLKGYSVYGVVASGDAKEKTAPYYVVQFETRAELSVEQKAAFAAEIDRQLYRTNEYYAMERTNRMLSPLRVEELEEGSYERYDKEKRIQNVSPDQYKRPLHLKL